MSAENDRIAAAVHDRVTNEIFGASLTLASVVSGVRVDEVIAQRLFDAIDSLDTALHDLRRLAFARLIADRDHNTALEIARATPPIIATRHGVERVPLRPVRSAQRFAHARPEQQFFGVGDHRYWNRRRDGLLPVRPGHATRASGRRRVV